MKRFFALFLALIVMLPLAVLASADTGIVAPSIEYKDVPEILPPVVILDEEKGKVVEVNFGDLLITSYAGRHCSYDILTKEQNEIITKALEKIYKNVNAVDDLGKLIPNLDAVAKSYDKKYNSSAFFVKDLFDITLIVGEYFKMVGAEYIRITFDTDLKEDDPTPVFVLYNYQEDKYNIVPDKDIDRRKDGSLSVDFDDVGQVLILGISNERVTPPTGDTQNLIVWAVVAVVSLVLAVSLIVYRRRQH